MQNLVQSFLELIHRGAVDNIWWQGIPIVPYPVGKEIPTKVSIVSLELKFITVISSTSLTQLEHVPVVNIVKPTEDFKSLNAQTPQPPSFRREEV